MKKVTNHISYFFVILRNKKKSWRIFLDIAPHFCWCPDVRRLAFMLNIFKIKNKIKRMSFWPP